MISGSYTFTIDELLKAQDYAVKETVRPWLRVMITPLGFCMVASAIFLSGSMDVWFRIYLGLVGVYLAVLRRPLTRSITKKHFSKRPDRNIVINFEISDAGIVWSTADSNSSLGWSLVSKVRRYQDGFLFFTNPKIFHWIPNHALLVPGQIESLSELFKTHVEDNRSGA